MIPKRIAGATEAHPGRQYGGLRKYEERGLRQGSKPDALARLRRLSARRHGNAGSDAFHQSGVTMKSAAAALLILTAVPAQADPTPYQVNHAAATLYSECQATDWRFTACLSYITGVSDMLATLPEFGIKPIACIPYTTAGADRLVFMRFAEAHPALLSEDKTDVVVLALMQAYPCKK